MSRVVFRSIRRRCTIYQKITSDSSGQSPYYSKSPSLITITVYDGPLTTPTFNLIWGPKNLLCTNPNCAPVSPGVDTLPSIRRPVDNDRLSSRNLYIVPD